MSIARIGRPEDGEAVSAERAALAWSMPAHAGVHSGVIGGWGVDPVLGVQTRDHRDLDLFVLETDVPALFTLLDATCSRPRCIWSENRWHDRVSSAFVADLDGIDPDGIDLDTHVVGLLDGAAERILSKHSIELPSGALSGSGVIGGRPVACATAEAPLVMHTGYELPEHHRRDLALLREHGER